MNAYCERFNRTLQDELVDGNLYDLEDTDEFNDKMSEAKYRKKCCYGRIQAQVIPAQAFDYSDIDRYGWYDKTHRDRDFKKQ